MLALGMDVSDASEGVSLDQPKLLETMEQILAIEAPDLTSSMQKVTELVAAAFGADKVDAMFLEQKTTTLVALGTSDTPMGRKQRALGLHRLPLANGGRAVRVYETGVSHRSGHVDDDPEELPGLVHELGIRSEIIAPVTVDTTRRGVILASDASYDAFSEKDLRFLEAIARWVGMVAHRAELTQQLLEESAERGRRIAGEELVTVLAHDVRNLLTPLVARMDLLRRRARRDDRTDDIRDLDVARRSAMRLSHLMENLLDVARLENGAFAIDPQPVELVTLIADTISTFETANRTITVHAPDAVEARVDPERMRQVLENLISNAVKHSPADTPIDVLVQAPGCVGDEPTDACTDERIQVSVKNAGPGVPPELMPRLFTRFAADSNSNGVGLGLYIARKIVELHGGEIGVDSAPGEGARFHVALPIVGHA